MTRDDFDTRIGQNYRYRVVSRNKEKYMMLQSSSSYNSSDWRNSKSTEFVWSSPAASRNRRVFSRLVCNATTTGTTARGSISSSSLIWTLFLLSCSSYITANIIQRISLAFSSPYLNDYYSYYCYCYYYYSSTTT